MADDHEIYRRWLQAGLRKPGKTQRELARRLEKLPMSISNAVRGVRKIKVAELKPMSEYIGEPIPNVGASVSDPHKKLRQEIRVIVGRYMAGKISAEIAMDKIGKAVM